jgi:dolichol-phosphate mannosyltransferase
MKSVIIIPTYNESQNIEKLVEEILILYPQISILIIDDNSTDGTGQIIREMAQRYGHIQVTHRPVKLGLGEALKAGYKLALEGNFDYVLQMDADFSHAPAEISKLINQAESGAGMVIGSRYRGGLRVRGWSFFRICLSFLGNLYTRVVLGFNIYDATSGFRCFRAEVLRGIDLDQAQAKGYAFQIEIAYLCYLKGYSIIEVPIHFARRKKGNSKLNFGIILEGLFTVLRLRFKKHSKHAV